MPVAVEGDPLSSATSILACPPEARSIAGAKPTSSFGTSSGRQAGLSKCFAVYGPATSRLQPSAFCRPGQPKTRQRSRRKRRGCGKPSLMPIGTPSNAVAASNTVVEENRPKRTTKRRPRLERDGVTISSSGSQGRAVVWVSRLQRSDVLALWCTLLTNHNTATIRGQSPSPFVVPGQCLEIHIGRGLARIPRVL